jgi:putative transposase
VHDSKLLEQTLKGIVCARPKGGKEPWETLCVDAGYVGYPVLVASRKQKYRLNLKTRAEERKEKLCSPDHQARRWVVERTHSWFNRFRKLLVSFEKTEASHSALLFLAAALICWRQTISIYG